MPYSGESLRLGGHAGKSLVRIEPRVFAFGGRFLHYDAKAPLFAPPTDPRYNAFDWETWHEIDVLRRELAPRFEAKNP